MKTKRYIKYFSCFLLVGMITSCGDDFIERLPKDTIVDANFYKTAEQIYAGTAPLYNIVWFAYNDKASHGIGDGRGGLLSSGSYQLENIQFRTTAVTGENTTSWRAFYNVVGQANALINNINKYADPGVPEEAINHAIAEARFMRGTAYRYLVMNWGAVPVFTDNIEASQDTTLRRNTIESVWEFITRDFRFAVDHLPPSPIQEGRLTSWAAKGMLAKVYLNRAGVEATSPTGRNSVYLDSARILAKDVIDNSGTSLMENYEDLFKTRYNNNEETLFALQWTFEGDDWGVQNTVQSYLAFSSAITGFGDGWGGDIGASYYILDKYEGLLANGFTVDKRRKATYMFPGDHYPYISQQVLDEEGNAQIQELIVPTGGEGYNGRAWVKKYVIGRPEDNEGKVRSQRNDMQTYMLRLADIYLIYAEAILGNEASTSDPEALKYFNEIRMRAGVSTKTVITGDDILNERLVEFAMEGQAWYDFVSLHYYDPQKAFNILSNQDRGYIRVTPNEFSDENSEVATRWTIEQDPDYTGQRFYNVNSGNFHLPLPEVEVSKAPNLRNEPVPYEFD